MLQEDGNKTNKKRRKTREKKLEKRRILLTTMD